MYSPDTCCIRGEFYIMLLANYLFETNVVIHIAINLIILSTSKHELWIFKGRPGRMNWIQPLFSAQYHANNIQLFRKCFWTHQVQTKQVYPSVGIPLIEFLINEFAARKNAALTVSWPEDTVRKLGNCSTVMLSAIGICYGKCKWQAVHLRASGTFTN